MPRKVYVASSWRNAVQPAVVSALREAGHEAYDFRHPSPDDPGFSWGNVAEGWKSWTLTEYTEGLSSQAARSGFKNDWDAMLWADTCVLVLPCGRSAHLEAGYFVGAGKELQILLSQDDFQPELMYRMATGLHTSLDSLLDAIL